MRQTLGRLTLAVLLFALSGCGASAETERPGRPEVYARIESMTDCDELQKEFDTAMTNWEAASNRNGPNHLTTKSARSYALLADERMKEIGCY